MRLGATDETGVDLLITQRSQVQILSPLQRSAGQRSESIDSGLFLVGGGGSGRPAQRRCT